MSTALAAVTDTIAKTTAQRTRERRRMDAKHITCSRNLSIKLEKIPDARQNICRLHWAILIRHVIEVLPLLGRHSTQCLRQFGARDDERLEVSGTKSDQQSGSERGQK